MTMEFPKCLLAILLLCLGACRKEERAVASPLPKFPVVRETKEDRRASQAILARDAIVRQGGALTSDAAKLS